MALLAGLPILVLLGAALRAGIDGGGFGARMLPIALADTFWLMVQVGLATGILGLSAAWLVAHFEFPGRRIFDWMLVLPLAVPTYLAAYCWVEFLDFTGPVQTTLRGLIGATSIRDYWFVDIRTPGGASFVMSLVLYPYVYLSCRAFFMMQAGAINAAARTLGASPTRTLFQVVLPLSRPALIVGITLALMEVVNDLGAVQYFGVNSLTAVIYATWLNRFNFGGAAQLAVAIVLIIGLLIWLEQWARRRRAYLGEKNSGMSPPREILSRPAAWATVIFLSLLVGLGFGVPFGELVAIASTKLAKGALPTGLGQAFANTLLLGTLGALVTISVGFYASFRTNRLGGSPATKGLIRLSTLGYAVPGTVLALGLTAALGYGDHVINSTSKALTGWGPGLVLSGSIFALVYAYAIRFLAIGFNPIDAARKRRGASVLDAANVLGAHGWRLIFRIDIPTLSPALIAAATLVFVECVKELPATLLLRPLGVETLATLVYSRASSELFDAAAIPALAIIAAGLIPVILASRLSQGKSPD